MKRLIKQLVDIGFPCCPGHDKWPNETYSNNRSKRARSKQKKMEHQYARSIDKRLIRKMELIEDF